MAAELAVPDGGGDVAPAGWLVQVHVERGVADRQHGVVQRGPLTGSVVPFHDAPRLLGEVRGWPDDAHCTDCARLIHIYHQ